MSYLERLRNRQSGTTGAKKTEQPHSSEPLEPLKVPSRGFRGSPHKGTQVFFEPLSLKQPSATEPLPTPADANRQAMPHIASVVDASKQAFGADQVKVTFAEENGVRLGRPPWDATDRQEGYEERAAIMEYDGNMTMQEAEQKAGTCYYCRHWQGTRSGKGFCCINFAPPVARQASETCEQFTLEDRS